MVSGVLAVRGRRLFDGARAVRIPYPVVLVEDGVFAAVGSRLTLPEGAELIDLADATLLPGLIDTHVHLAFDASPDPVGALGARDDGELVAAMVAAARAGLRGGVTAMRDLGDRDYQSLRLRGRPDLPTILASGPPITTSDGHCHFLGGAVAPTVRAARAAVRAHHERGVDVIKIMASGGNLTPGTRQDLAQFPAGVLAAAVDEAHRLGLPVTAHAHAVTAMADAIAAGVDGLEHATFWTADGIDARPELIDAIVRAGIVIGATVGMVQVPGASPPPEVLRRLPAAIAALARLHRAGGVLVAGTDAGIGPMKPPDAVRYAPTALRELGMSPAEAMRAVTSVAAQTLGLGQVKGRIAPGYQADLLAVEGDPCADLSALQQIRLVLCRGAIAYRSPAGGPAKTG